MSVSFSLKRHQSRCLLAAASVGLAVGFATDAEAAARKRNSTPRSQLAAVAVTDPLKAPLAAPIVPRATAQPRLSTPQVAVVSLNAQSVTIYAGTEVIAKAPISSGMEGHRTPTGVFSIIQKNRYHESNLYSNAPMPFMQRLTWSGVAFHAGKLPGYPASHGCIRLPYEFAERLFGMIKMGTRVVVAPEVATPSEFVHARLPAPVLVEDTMTAELTPRPLQPGLSLAAVGSIAPETVAPRWLNPMQVAELEKRRMAGVATDAARLAKDEMDRATAAIAKADAARADRLTAEADLSAYREMAARAVRAQLAAQNQTGKDDEDRVQAEASAMAASEAVEDAERALASARVTEQRYTDASFVAVRSARETEDAADRAAAAAGTASRGTEPVTIFVSRKENRVLVRQGFHTILEGDVTFQDPDAAIGTHVLTAGLPIDAGAALRWTSLSISDGSNSRGSAHRAMDRIEIEPQLSSEIARRLWTGATLIISDQGISRETGKGTDFVVLTK